MIISATLTRRGFPARGTQHWKITAYLHPQPIWFQDVTAS